MSARRAGSLTLHCLLAWPVALLPSVALVSVAYGLAGLLGIDAMSFAAPDREASFWEFFGCVFLAPCIETFLLAGLLALLSRASSRPLFIAAVSGVLWGALHGMYGLMWFFGTFWSFYVMSCSYLAWRPLGYWQAFAAAAVPHALLNLTVMSLVALAA